MIFSLKILIFFLNQKKSINNLKSLVFRLTLTGKLDFQKLSNGRVKQPLQTLIQKQKDYLKKRGISFEEKLNSVWPMVKLNNNNCIEIIDGDRGKNYPKKSEFTKKGYCLFLNTSNVRKGYFNFDRCNFISKKRDNLLKNGRGKKFDIVLTTRGTLGNSALYEPTIPYSCLRINSGMVLLRCNQSKLNPYFLIQIINSDVFDKQIKKYLSGSAQPQLPIKVLSDIIIPLPPLEVQKEIVSLMEKCILLEAQIKEKSQKQNEFSKSSMYFIAQAQNKKQLFHHWGILKNNFKDVLCSESGVKEFKAMAFQLCLNGRLDFQKLSEGRIKKSLQILVQQQKQHLKEEDITFEEQPDSIWPMVKLGSVCNFINGKAFKPEEWEKMSESGLPIIRIQNLNNLQAKFNYYSKKVHEKYLVKKSDLLFSWSGSKGTSFGPHIWAKDKGILNQHIFRVEHSSKYLKRFLYLALKKIVVEVENNLHGGVGLVHITKGNLEKLKIPFPPLEVQKEIAALMEYIESTEKQIQKEKSLSVQLSQSLSHLEKYQKIV